MVESNDEQFMKAALAEAQKAFDRQEVPVGAVVVCNNMIIARAHNLTETLKDPTAHAEMQAITAAANWLGGKYLTDCIIYVTVEPCAMCAAAIGWSQAARACLWCSRRKKRLHRNIRVFASSQNRCRSGTHERGVQWSDGKIL